MLQRIEEYKEQISRADLLAIADEAVRELEFGPEGQLVLTEVLMLEHVDRLITRRLKLPTFRRWRARHVELRQAQRDPAYWGIDPDSPVAALAARLDESDVALAVGAGSVKAALFLAAHDWPVLLAGQELRTVESAEARAAAEGLASRFQALVVCLGQWFPDVAPSLAVVDTAAIGELDAPTRVRVLDALKQRTPPGGVHCLMTAKSVRGAIALAPEVLQAHYADWSVRRSRAERPPCWILATRP